MTLLLAVVRRKMLPVTVLFLVLCQYMVLFITAEKPTFSWIRHYEPHSILKVEQLLALYPFDRDVRNVARDRFNSR